MTDIDYADDLELLINTPTQTESLLYSLEQATRSIGLYMNTNKTVQEGVDFILIGKHRKLDYFTYLGSDISSTESDVNICMGNAWTAIDRLMIIW